MNFPEQLTDIQSVDIHELCQKYGTPLYVYDGGIIRKKVKSLQDAFSAVDMHIKYACKANTNLALMRLMRSLGVEVDVVSLQEMQMALLAGYAPQQITFTPSGVPYEEVKQAVDGGATVNVDSLPLLEWFGQTYGNTRSCLIRLKPNVTAGGNVKIMTGHSDSKLSLIHI